MYPCIILCGGFATRLGSIASVTPKCLLEVNSKPFLYYQLKYLEKSGIKDIYLSVGHLSERFTDFVKKYEFSVSITLINDGPLPLGTGGAVKNIIQKINSPAFVMYGDSFLRANFTNIFNTYNENSGPLIVIYKNQNKYDKSNVYFDGNSITYNKSRPNKLCEHIDYGIGVYKYKDFEKTSESFDLSLIQEKFSIEKKLQFFEATERFYEIGTPESYKESNIFFQDYEA